MLIFGRRCSTPLKQVWSAECKRPALFFINFVFIFFFLKNTYLIIANHPGQVSKREQKYDIKSEFLNLIKSIIIL